MDDKGGNMGCDEHMFVERLRQGVWVPVDPPDYLGWNSYMEDSPELAQLAQAFDEDPYPLVANYWNFGRNYRAYGYLAGVRGRAIIMLKEPVGLPFDTSKLVKQYSDAWGADGHSHTYYTLAELAACLEPLGKDDPEGLERIHQLVRLMKEVAEKYRLDHESVRMIVWFDN